MKKSTLCTMKTCYQMNNIILLPHEHLFIKFYKSIILLIPLYCIYIPYIDDHLTYEKVTLLAVKT